MDKFEKLVKEIMTEAEKDGEPVTKEEAEEMAKMELGAKQIKNYVSSKSKKKSTKPRTVKVSDEKVTLFESILKNLDRADGVLRENITVLKQNKLIQVEIGDKKFKIDLIQCRK